MALTMRYLLLLLAVILLPAQEAIVVPLSDADAALMSSLYKQHDELEARLVKERARIGKQYATWDDGAPNLTGFTPKPPAFTFSKDFKYIVPDTTSGSYTTTGSVMYCNQYGCRGSGGVTLAPASSFIRAPDDHNLYGR